MLQFEIPAILRQKAPGVRIPSFLVRYLERITHVEQMNRFLRNHPQERNYDFIRLVLNEELQCTASIEGTENIPQDKRPVIFVSNHPLGGLDGMIIAQMIHDTRIAQGKDTLPLRVIVNDLLMYMEPIADLWVPVSKISGQSREYARQYQAAWEKEQDMLTFPAGACSRKQKKNGKWVIEDLEWQKSFVQKAIQYKRDVVPIYFDGHNSEFFYRLAYWRKKLGIKLNIEMLYLVDEMYGAHGQHFTVHVLPPVPYTTFDQSRTPKQWAEYIKNIVYGRNH